MISRRALLLAAPMLLVPVAVQAQGTKPCPTCFGRGDWIDPRTGRIQTCPTCHGRGVVIDDGPKKPNRWRMPRFRW